MTELVPRCPSCAYNVTGLPQPRCPECGGTFDWDEVWRAAVQPRTIAFERLRGWGRLPAFFLTALTVLLTPWIFARQVTRKASLCWAAIFAGLCLVSTSICRLFGAEGELLVAWPFTAAVAILAEALLLSVLDVPHWSAPLATLRFWIIVACYTSAVMLTEFWSGPPLLEFDKLWRILTGAPPAGWLSMDPRPLGWVQLAIWLAAPSICMWMRWRAARRKFLAILAALMTATALLFAYAFVFEYVGVNVYHWLD